MRFAVEVNIDEKTIANNLIYNFADLITDEISEQVDKQCGMTDFNRFVDITKIQLKVYEEIIKLLSEGD